MPPGPPSSPSLPPGPPSSPSLPPGPPSSPGSPSSPDSSSSSSLTNVTPLPPPDSSRKTPSVTVRPSPTMSKIAISKRYQSDDLDDALKELDEQKIQFKLCLKRNK